MPLATKSIQEKPGEDGLRICIMRRIKPEFLFDVWMPELSPSTELLKSYHDKEIDWDEYEAIFTKEVLTPENKSLNALSQIAEKQLVTILCWEEEPSMCHRRLVAEKIEKMNPQIKIKHV